MICSCNGKSASKELYLGIIGIKCRILFEYSTMPCSKVDFVHAVHLPHYIWIDLVLIS
jgi:hypothetical protein